MRLVDIIRLSIKVLTERKIRAVLTITGVAIGPLTLMMIGSIVTGVGEFIVSSITGLGQSLIVVFPETGYRLSREDLQFLRNIPGVEDVSPFYTFQGSIVVNGVRKTVYIYGVNPEFIVKAITSLRVLEGRVPLETEFGRALIGYSIVYDNGVKHYELNDVLSITIYNVGKGGRVEVKKLNVMITGILDRFGGALFLNPDMGVIIPLETIEKTIGVREWSGILVLASSPELVKTIEREIRDTYTNKASVVSFIAIAETVSNVVEAVDFVTFAASTSSFAVAIAGVAASMITSVIERTREIGIMKAIGFRDKQILLLIISEGVLISFIGFIIGSTLGVVGARILANSTGFRIGVIEIRAEPKFTLDLFIRSILLTHAVGVLGALFPAYRAMKIPPAVALKYE
ncbi:MAG: FtsX-like permease family protein [Desulfurococcaceae archaeon]